MKTVNKKSNSCLESDIKIKLLPYSKRSNSHFSLAVNILPKSKRSQITIILIVSIVLALSLIIFFAFKNQLFTEYKISEIDNINNLLQECIKQRSIDAIYLIGLQGGYAKTPEKNVKLDNYNIAYGLYNNKNTLASLQKIESEISNYIELTVPFCINEQDFPQIDIKQEKPEVNARINENFVKISSKPKLYITKDNKVVEFNRKYETEIPIRLGKIHSTANSIINKHIENKEFIPLTFLSEQEFDIIFGYYSDTELVYTITDLESEIDETPYSFRFIIEIK